MSLKNWSDNGWLVEHSASDTEIGDLLKIADRDLRDCRVKGVSADWRFNIAYNAALQSSRAVLFACGYRAAREAHHHRVIQSLGLTLKLPQTDIKKFEMFRTKRNFSDYESAGAVSENEVLEMTLLAVRIRSEAESYLKLARPGVFPL